MKSNPIFALESNMQPSKQLQLVSAHSRKLQTILVNMPDCFPNVAAIGEG